MNPTCGRPISVRAVAYPYIRRSLSSSDMPSSYKKNKTASEKTALGKDPPPPHTHTHTHTLVYTDSPPLWRQFSAKTHTRDKRLFE